MIFYTCITNGYDKLPQVYIDSEVRYVCFHDGSIELEGPWEFIELEYEHDCPVRRSYHPKHCPHLYFDEGEYVIWIDGSYDITKELIDFSKINKLDFVLQSHPDQRSLLGEFKKLYGNGFSTADEIMSMAKKIKNTGFKLYDYDQTINSVIWRRLTPDVIEWCKTWRKWYMDGVNRDQISSNVAEYLTIKAHRVPLQVQMTGGTRQKSYGESYTLHPKGGNIMNELLHIFLEWHE